MRPMICHVCQRPALDVSSDRVPHCGRHASRIADLARIGGPPEELQAVTAKNVDRTETS
jgi:hypothetical protein